MPAVQFLKLENGDSAFAIEEEGERLAEMVVHISDNIMTVYHTEVTERLEGQGVGKKLLQAMTAYAKEHNLQVVPLCPFVHLQFKRNPEVYAAIWKH